MQATNTVRMDRHALSTLRYIRASMESASSVAVPGSAGVFMGAIGTLAAIVSLAPIMRQHWLAVWLLAAAVAGGVGGALQFRPAWLRRRDSVSAPLGKFSLCLFPSLFGGAIMTAVLLAYGNAEAIAGTWLLLYGCALISASVLTTARIAVMGSLFVVLGLLALLLRDVFVAQMVLLGAGFGGLHLWFGMLIGRSTHGD
jgi:hypothetical protein